VTVDEQLFFHRTGSRAGSSLVAPVGVQPALFARFGDLARLRYDFPLVLTPDGPATLSGAIDDLLSAVPKGLAGERQKRTLLRLERAIRARTDSGETGTLAEVWDRSASALAERGGQPVAEDLTRARAALTIDGELLAFDARVASRFVAHIWRAAQDRKAAVMRQSIQTLALRLADLVKADHLRSAAGRKADALRAGVGGAHQDLFDFDLMASLLAAPSGGSALSPRRRVRIERALRTLRAQRFFGEGAFGFEFARVDDALAAYRGRGAAMAELMGAIATAELELQGGYVDAKHDAYFQRFGIESLGSADLALFPDYLVRVAPGEGDAVDRARLLEALTSRAPLKLLFETDDAFGLGAQLATTAMGLGDAFVLQSSAARLFALRDRVREAIEFSGPALLSIFTGSHDGGAAPRYLVAAAATESRAFPTLTYDPSRGEDWAQRLVLCDDPQQERPWPEHELAYADGGSRAVRERVAFTFADFAVTDPAQSAHFARVSRDEWSDRLVPLATWLDGARPGDVPFVYAVDADAGLCKLAVDTQLSESARRCANAWRRLREIDDLKHERVASSGTALLEPVAAAAVDAVAAAADARPAESPVERASSSDEPYIETPRCTSCNECTNVNPRLFGYDQNKQAFIKDVAAGTYKDLVEAAEGCQVAIIHPGKPRDPNEPGLDELIQRAAQFA
jgi:ferredoxin